MASAVYLIPIDPNRPVNEVYDNSEQLSYKEDVRTLLKSNLNILNKADRAQALNEWHSALMKQHPTVAITSIPATATDKVWWLKEANIEVVLSEPSGYVDAIIDMSFDTNIDWKEFHTILINYFNGSNYTSKNIVPIISMTSYAVDASTGRVSIGKYRGYVTNDQATVNSGKPETILLGVSHVNTMGTLIHELIGHDLGNNGQKVIDPSLPALEELWNTLNHKRNPMSPLGMSQTQYKTWVQSLPSDDIGFWHNVNPTPISTTVVGTYDGHTYTPPEARFRDLLGYIKPLKHREWIEEFLVRMLVYLLQQRGTSFTIDIRSIFKRAGISLSDEVCFAVDHEFYKMGLDNVRRGWFRGHTNYHKSIMNIPNPEDAEALMCVAALGTTSSTRSEVNWARKIKQEQDTGGDNYNV